MGNCCKKRQTSRDYQPIREKIHTGGAAIATNIYDKDQSQSEDAPTAVPSTVMTPVCPHIYTLVQSLGLSAQLDSIILKLSNLDYTGIKRISDDQRDAFELWINVHTDEHREKIHTTIMKYQSHMSPMHFKLANTLMSESDELTVSPNYDRYRTLHRWKSDGVYYVVNYALYKQIMLFSQKDILFVKAFKPLPSGDVVEVTVSISHPDFPENGDTERMKIIDNYTVYAKNDDGCYITAVNILYPRVGAGFTILKPLFIKAFRGYHSNLQSYLSNQSKTEDQLNKEFGLFRENTEI